LDRRVFLGSLAGLLAAPLAAEAQGTSVRRIGYIYQVPQTPVVDGWWEVFITGLSEYGWIEHQNLVVERRPAEFRKEAALTAAQELVRIKVEVIVVASTVTALAAKEATATVPIVMTIPGDLVGTGLAQSLARPGGNVTGLTFVGTELAAKQLELLKEAVPGLTTVAVLTNPGNASHPPRIKEIASAVRVLKLQLEVVEASTQREVEEAFRTMAKRRPGAAIVLSDGVFARKAGKLARLAAEQRLPVMYGFREHVLAGGLMAYGPSFADLFRRAAGYVDKILKGAKPADLPVEQPTKFELVINLKTAKVLGLTIPQSLQLRADQVIE
jgi:putative ABC transport system substrate-binding protein